MRNIISSAAFDEEVEKLGGARAIDEALSPVLEALSKNPYGFDKFEADGFSFRWVQTRETYWTPALAIIFTIDKQYNVILEHIEVLG